MRSSCIVLNSLGIKTEGNGILGNPLLYSQLHNFTRALPLNHFYGFSLDFSTRVDRTYVLLFPDIKTIKLKSLNQVLFFVDMFHFFSDFAALFSTNITRFVY